MSHQLWEQASLWNPYHNGDRTKAPHFRQSLARGYRHACDASILYARWLTCSEASQHPLVSSPTTNRDSGVGFRALTVASAFLRCKEGIRTASRLKRSILGLEGHGDLVSGLIMGIIRFPIWDLRGY